MDSFEGNPESFAGKQKLYFERLAGKYRNALRLHESPGGLWEKDREGRDWRNVTDHCLMEAARAEVFAEKLRLSQPVADDLMTAAALHDFYKKFEIQRTREDIAAGGSGRAGYQAAEMEALEHLRKAGYRDSIVQLVDSVGGEPETLMAMQEIAPQEDISEENIARLVIHYIDDYTAGNAWVTPVTSGENANDIDRRMKKNAGNPDYKKMNQEVSSFYAGKPFFDGMDRFMAQSATGHLIEKRLVELIAARGGESIDPLYLPEVIDEILKKKIEAVVQR